jgi:hypothetical protein
MVPAAGLADAIFEHGARPAPTGLAGSVVAVSTATKGGLDLFRVWLNRKRVRMLLRVAGSLGAVVASVTLGVAILRPWIVRGAPVKMVEIVAPSSVPPAAADVDPPTYPVALTFEQIMDGLRRTEHEFQNVHVRDFETTEDRLAPGQTQWTATPIRYAGSAWYDADPRGRQRIYFSDSVLPWENGAAPLSEEAVETSWDGKEGLVLRLAEGPPHHLVRLRMAMISVKREDVFVSPVTPWFTGIGYTAQYLVMNDDLSFEPRPRKLLSDTLEAVGKAHGAPDIVGQTINGFDTVRVHFELRYGSDSYWFDPSRGFSLVKVQTVVNFPNRPGQSSTEGVEVQEFKGVGPGIWFPVRASMVRKEGQPIGSYIRCNYRAVDVVVNDPKFDPAVLQATIPTGWVVDDVRGKTRRTYVTMEDGSEMELHVGSVMPHMKAGVATRPDEPGPAITRDPAAAW